MGYASSVRAISFPKNGRKQGKRRTKSVSRNAFPLLFRGCFEGALMPIRVGVLRTTGGVLEEDGVGVGSIGADGFRIDLGMGFTGLEGFTGVVDAFAARFSRPIMYSFTAAFIFGTLASGFLFPSAAYMASTLLVCVQSSSQMVLRLAIDRPLLGVIQMLSGPMMDLRRSLQEGTSSFPSRPLVPPVRPWLSATC